MLAGKHASIQTAYEGMGSPHIMESIQGTARPDHVFCSPRPWLPPQPVCPHSGTASGTWLCSRFGDTRRTSCLPEAPGRNIRCTRAGSHGSSLPALCHLPWPSGIVGDRNRGEAVRDQDDRPGLLRSIAGTRSPSLSRAGHPSPLLHPCLSTTDQRFRH
jgi:hypothetical protein